MYPLRANGYKRFMYAIMDGAARAAGVAGAIIPPGRGALVSERMTVPAWIKIFHVPPAEKRATLHMYIYKYLTPTF